MARRAPQFDPEYIKKVRAEQAKERSARPGVQYGRDEIRDTHKGLYRVVGDREVGGKKKGDLVTLHLTNDSRDSLIEAGHIEPVDESEAADELPKATVKPVAKVREDNDG